MITRLICASFLLTGDEIFFSKVISCSSVPAGLWLSPAHLDSSISLNSLDSQCMKSPALGFLVVGDHQIPDIPILGRRNMEWFGMGP